MLSAICGSLKWSTTFLSGNNVTEDPSQIDHVPGYIVHGRYDLVCPIDQAFLLKDHWDNAQLKIIPDAGHAVTEHGISKALVECCNSMLEIVT